MTIPNLFGRRVPNLFDKREPVITAAGLGGDPQQRYRRASWRLYFDSGDWRIGLRLARRDGEAEIHLPMLQLVREPWYSREAQR